MFSSACFPRSNPCQMITVNDLIPGKRRCQTFPVKRGWYSSLTDPTHEPLFFWIHSRELTISCDDEHNIKFVFTKKLNNLLARFPDNQAASVKDTERRENLQGSAAFCQTLECFASSIMMTCNLYHPKGRSETESPKYHIWQLICGLWLVKTSRDALITLPHDALRASMPWGWRAQTKRGGWVGSWYGYTSTCRQSVIPVNAAERWLIWTIIQLISKR